MSESNYTNNILVLNWIKHFDKSTKLKLIKTYRLLLFDGYGSYITYKFIIYCDKYKIILIVFSPHTTYFMQLLNIDVF